jgi:hypothetical protein
MLAAAEAAVGLPVFLYAKLEILAPKLALGAGPSPEWVEPKLLVDLGFRIDGLIFID